MSQSLIERQTVALAAHATSALIPHTLRDPNGPIAPNWIYPTKLTTIRPLSWTSAGVVYVNDGDQTDSATFSLKYDMTPQRSSAQGVPAGIEFIYAGAAGVLNGAAGFSNDPALDLPIYLDGINGLDTNDGLSPTTAKRTFAAITRSFPQIVAGGAKILLHIAGTGGFGVNATAPLSYEEPTFLVAGPGNVSHNGYCIRAAERVPFLPTTGPATAALDVVPCVEVDQAGAAAPGTGFRTRFDFTAAAPGWTVNNFRTSRACLRVRRAGVDVIPETPIAENTADTITIDVLCVAQILATDTVEIVRQSVEFTGPAVDFNTFVITGGGTIAPFDTDGIGGPGNGNTIEGVAFVGRAVLQRFIGGLDRCAASGTSIVITFSDVSFMQCKFQCSTQMMWTIANRQPGHFRAASAVNPINQGALFRQALCVVGTMTIGDMRGGPAAYQVDDALGKYAGSSLRVWGPGSSLSVSGSSSANIFGSGATGSGLWARFGAKVVVNPGTRTQITGATGALRVGVSAVIVAYGTGVGQFEEVAGFNGNLYRMDGSTPAAPTGDESQIALASVM